MDFETVYIRHFAAVYRFLLSMCRDPSLSEELAQETFERALRAYERFDGRCAPDTWLCSIAKNCYFAHCRKQKRILLGEVPEDAGLPLEEQLAQRAALEEIHQTLHELEEPYKEVFSLRVFAGLSYAQLGALFGRSDTWARVTYYRAKSKLQERIGGKTDE